jgi:hypothetical protein
LGREFTVRTDHFSLKYLLDQRLSTIPQHQWASKLLGFDFKVEYKSSAMNIVADALSRHDTAEAGELMALSLPTFALFDELRAELAGDPELRSMRDEVMAGERGEQWQVVDGLITMHGKLYVPASSSSVSRILESAHGIGHEGAEKTLHPLRADFHIPGARKAVRDFVRACATYQRNKTEQLHPAGLLQPLELPSTVWADVAMDFVEGFPHIHGKSVILTVVDRFLKYAHFLPLGHPYTATSVAWVFFDGVVRLHGIPSSIVSDRDPVFTSQFWRELFALSGVKLNMSSAFHPQSDGQSEATNKVITMYLRCLTGDRPHSWLQWLPWAEFCYNSAFHSSIRTSPFKVVYGREPPSVRAYTTGEARLPPVQQQLTTRDEFLVETKERLEQAQQYYKLHYDRKHREVEFQVGQLVWLRLISRPLASLEVQGRGKLGPK